MGTTEPAGEWAALWAPLRGQGRPLAIALGSLALLVLWLQLGGRAFFAAHIAPLVFGPLDPTELGWWWAWYHWATAGLLFGVLPALLLRLGLGERLTALGLGLGNRRLGFGVVLPLGLLLAVPMGLVAGVQPAFQAEYPLACPGACSASMFVLAELGYGLLYYTAYEAFFRGMVQQSLARYWGVLPAIAFQTALTTLLHVGKPGGELASALVAGVLLGLLVVRIRSVWPLVLVHWVLGISTDLFSAWFAVS